ncbi:endonuclease/exonuclease/phosphatase family protein (plasmid) [Halorarum salinum]|uniref:Endonuclease/exonuclease/phosphatase family protein n=2 Tax=Halorarum salinum TaxID=2743089 RepID=A0A7D5QEM0_9EURY|nr:endonuclease/exonuclease/phosphatase family protein [Halobaculum salinum]
MSYNVRFDNPEVDPYTWRERRDDVASVIRFHRPDVVGLQEALHGQLEDLRERLPSYEWLSAGRAEARNAGEYAAVGYDADRFELVEESAFWLSESPDERGSVGWDARFPRLVRWVRLRERATDAELVHFNTHFDHEGETARLRSADLLADRIRETAPEAAVVVTGDLNCVESDAPYRRLVGDRADGPEGSGGPGDGVADGRSLCDGLYASDTPHHGPVTTTTEFDALVPDRKIDHVLISSDVEVTGHAVCADTTGEGLYPSDHLPILADLAVPIPAAERATAAAAGSGTADAEHPTVE